MKLPVTIKAVNGGSVARFVDEVRPHTIWPRSRVHGLVRKLVVQQVPATNKEIRLPAVAGGSVLIQYRGGTLYATHDEEIAAA